MRKLFALFIVVLAINNNVFPQRNLYSTTPPDKAKFEFTDFGNMWTFDAAPVDSFEARYGFSPDSAWLKKVMRSALQFGTGCSGAFVSQNGLIMTNHHCGRNKLKEIEKEGENLLRDGFYAETLTEERKVPGLFADQLITIEDVTDEVLEAFYQGKTSSEKLDLRKKKIAELEKAYEAKTGLTCKVVNLYNGKKFSLYAYKRYNDIRLVMSPDFQIAATGWDWDNFTYPRYELDFMFFRAYENNKPVAVENYFPIAPKPIKENEAVFIIGRPGHTDRRISVGELMYLKNHVYRQRMIKYDALYNAYFYLFRNCKDESKHSELLNAVMGFGNGRKSYAGRLLGLRDKFLLAKKIDFEKQLKNKVRNNARLDSLYGDVWEKIDSILFKTSEISDKFAAYTLSPFFMPEYARMAAKLKKSVRQNESHTEEAINKTLANIVPENLNEQFVRLKNKKLTEALLEIFKKLIPEDSLTLFLLSNENNLEKAAEKLLEKSVFTTKKEAENAVIRALKQSELPNDPFIKLIEISEKKSRELQKQMKELRAALAIENQRLSKAITEVYGDVIPPDATLTLRISDGKVKGYEYNGTLAPAKTSFYGLWNRYVSFGKKEYPWGLHERWQKPPENFNLETPIGFASTNDIVGGNSGSSVINVNGEVVGLVHDGNIESLAGHFIFDPTNNRAVSSDIFGILEALKYVYKTNKLVNELKNGKID